MKSIKTIAAVIALTAVAGTASAMVPQSDVAGAVNARLGGSSNVIVTVSGDTATLVGTVADAGDKYGALQAGRCQDRALSNAKRV